MVYKVEQLVYMIEQVAYTGTLAQLAITIEQRCVQVNI